MGFVPSLFKKCAAIFILLNLSIFNANAQTPNKILVWGDSLSAAYGIPVEKSWVSLLQNKLGDDYEVINGSISGETTQGGLNRIDSAIKTLKPNYIILELGANDGLRGFPPQVTKKNLQSIIEKSIKSNVKVILLGMKIPPNYGIAYAQKFENQFSELATLYNLPFIPFFLENIIENLDYFQKDQLHPTAEAQTILLDTILPTILTTIESDKKKLKIKNPA